jgi:hypothetical protein
MLKREVIRLVINSLWYDHFLRVQPSESCVDHVTVYSLIYIRPKAQYCGRHSSDLLLVSYAYLVLFSL